MGKPGTGSEEEKVLIWGAGGAVGSYAVQYAKSVSRCHELIPHLIRNVFLTVTRLGTQW
jgi:hypothetical protein